MEAASKVQLMCGDCSAEQRGELMEHRSLTTVTYDGYEWRNYGAKTIPGTTFKRYYYRCSYISCPARKRAEQWNNDDPPLYLVTYLKEHTCNVVPATAHLQNLLNMSHSDIRIPPRSFCSAGFPKSTPYNMGQMINFQPQPDINKVFSSSSLLQNHAYAAGAPDCDAAASAAPLMNLSTSQPLEDSSLIDVISFATQGMETSGVEQAAMSNLVDLPAPSGVMVIGSVEIETYAFEDVFSGLENFEFEL